MLCTHYAILYTAQFSLPIGRGNQWPPGACQMKLDTPRGRGNGALASAGLPLPLWGTAGLVASFPGSPPRAHIYCMTFDPNEELRVLWGD